MSRIPALSDSLISRLANVPFQGMYSDAHFHYYASVFAFSLTFINGMFLLMSFFENRYFHKKQAVVKEVMV